MTRRQVNAEILAAALIATETDRSDARIIIGIASYDRRCFGKAVSLE